MDILNLKQEDLLQLEVMDYLRAVKYSWNAFNLRRTDLPWQSKKKKGDDVMNWDQSEMLKRKMSKVGRANKPGRRKH